MLRSTLLIVASLLWFVSPALAAARPAEAAALPPCRIFALNRQGAAFPLSFEQLIADLRQADVVICGEYHDDPASHQMEHALLSALASAHQGNLAMTMEMFERDVQSVIDAYWQGRLSEQEFLAASRPWGNYQTDYRPLIETARRQGIVLLAANPPTALARKVAREGMLAMRAGLQEGEAAWLARETSAPEDGYWQRFASVMGGTDPTHGGMAEDKLRQFYAAQCLKDDTMAETIVGAAQWWQEGGRTRRAVLHFNGSFHSDYHYGVAQRVRQRAPELLTYTVALRPVADFLLPSAGGSMDPQGETLPDGTPVADFVVFVPAPEPQAPAH